MDEARNRYVRELIDAINAAVAQEPAVQACRQRARAAGLELSVSIEVVVGAADQNRPASRAAAPAVPGRRRLLPAAATYQITAADRRFLRSLRIAAAEEP
jgi:hypothetical protein